MALAELPIGNVENNYGPSPLRRPNLAGNTATNTGTGEAGTWVNT